MGLELQRTYQFMKLYNINEFTKGWVVGDFSPAILNSKEIEVAYKTYQAGDNESKHMHQIATEITIVAFGRVCMNGTEYDQGDVVVIEPGEATDFVALTSCATVVIKSPSVLGDKYLV